MEPKPPLGVIPEYVIEFNRCKDLARAIHEYFEAGTLWPKEEWISELAKRFPLAVLGRAASQED